TTCRCRTSSRRRGRRSSCRWWWSEDGGARVPDPGHNPLVAATCPDCGGGGQWCQSDPATGAHLYCGCPRCHMTGMLDEPARLFEDDQPPAVGQVSPDG